jgi:hypothetical protein
VTWSLAGFWPPVRPLPVLGTPCLLCLAMMMVPVLSRILRRSG